MTQPRHPGQVLLDDFLGPAGLSCRQLAREIGVPVTRITNVTSGKNGLSALTAMMLAERFDTSVEFWTGAQMAWDIAQAKPDWEAFKAERAKRRKRLGVG